MIDTPTRGECTSTSGPGGGEDDLSAVVFCTCPGIRRPRFEAVAHHMLLHSFLLFKSNMECANDGVCTSGSSLALNSFK